MWEKSQATKGTEAANEWVEIYNPTGSSVDISGWQICDNTACDTIPAATPAVPSHGFALIANSATTWSSFWAGTPAAAVKIGLGSAIGGGLANAGDRVILKDAALVAVDAMSYGTDLTYMSLPEPKVGISLARIVKGYDTDLASDWVLNNTPNPGTNPSDADGSEVMRFTSEGIEVAATEEGLPPIPDSTTDQPAATDQIAPTDTPADSSTATAADTTPTDTTTASSTSEEIISEPIPSDLSSPTPTSSPPLAGGETGVEPAVEAPAVLPDETIVPVIEEPLPLSLPSSGEGQDFASAEPQPDEAILPDQPSLIPVMDNAPVPEL